MYGNLWHRNWFIGLKERQSLLMIVGKMAESVIKMFTFDNFPS